MTLNTFPSFNNNLISDQELESSNTMKIKQKFSAITPSSLLNKSVMKKNNLLWLVNSDSSKKMSFLFPPEGRTEFSFYLQDTGIKHNFSVCRTLLLKRRED